MRGYTLVNLKELLQQLGEEETKGLLSNFSCPLNPDVEYFLHTKAIEFSRQGIAQTHLVFMPYKGQTVLVGYFTLASKMIVIPKKNVPTANWRRRIRRFAQQMHPDGEYVIAAPLIGQLGKNFTNGYNTLLAGDVLLKMATDKVSTIQNDLGGKFVYLECEDKPSLIDFYSQNGFVIFGHRDLDGDERDKQQGSYLVQMLKYLGG